ncbi:hypothetical protein [Tateyamaria sp. ANG-S1]|uniref:antibiotic biosynthesis monooxygenase family protein n=1 Tax=Tateyamaria sp. ANG-S1 TaxID=1577905 RepID=UPI00057EACD4|nr:hypothetical protein [Tateyamaria sp. ANG-S1]KIC51368.1 hypothetical protein RA29_05990 [Tateyamaria sp. ANG-S1]
MFRSLFLASALTLSGMAIAQADTIVIEVATMTLAEGMTPEDFAEIDARVDAEHVSQQPGFISRQSGYEGDAWVAIVEWESHEAAQASMDSFVTAPAAAEFMGGVDAESIVMTRYTSAN